MTQQSCAQTPPLKVVIAEDDDADAKLLLRSLADGWSGGIETVVLARIEDLERELADSASDVVFCDLSLVDCSGIEVVNRAVAAAGMVPVVVLTSNADPEIAVRALEAGAQDYLAKGTFDSETLARTLRYSIARSSAERENRRIARHLSQVHEELDRYAHILAHDLRAPVRTARLFADRLVAMSGGDKDPTQVAAALDGSLERLELMIGQFQRIATLRDSGLKLLEEPLSTIVADIGVDLSEELLASDASLTCPGEAMVTADPVLIRDLVRELVQNSIAYRSAERDLVIAVAGEQLRSTTGITVTDNGVGIDSQFRERVFRLFERLDAIEGSHVGFGLAFCQQVTEMHGGSIAAVEPGAQLGAAIRVELPNVGVSSA